MLMSAKQGLGVPELFEAIIDRFSPPPKAKPSDPLKCFLFDARYVDSRGVACLIKVMQGTLDIE